MPPRGHDPAWPDKAMFSALCLVLGGALGVLFELGRSFIVTGGQMYLFTDDIPFYTLAMTAATLVLGLVCLRTQAALFGYLGAATAVLSLGLFGLVTFLGLTSIAFMVKAHVEGEETRNDGVTLKASQWPDKALALSMVLFVGGALLLMQVIAIALGSFVDPLLPGGLAIGIDLVAGLATIVCAREVFHLRRPWTGMLGALLCIATFATYVLGPALGVAALVLLALAKKEGEFDPMPEDQVQQRRPGKEKPLEQTAQ